MRRAKIEGKITQYESFAPHTIDIYTFFNLIFFLLSLISVAVQLFLLLLVLHVFVSQKFSQNYTGFEIMINGRAPG